MSFHSYLTLYSTNLLILITNFQLPAPLLLTIAMGSHQASLKRSDTKSGLVRVLSYLNVHKMMVEVAKSYIK